LKLTGPLSIQPTLLIFRKTGAIDQADSDRLWIVGCFRCPA
jgi:hypothetical protein